MGKEREMAFGLPNISFIGYPVSLPCAGHAGLGFREAHRRDTPGIVAHFRSLDAGDRRMRFCATLTDAAIERHVAGVWERRSLVLAAYDGPIWDGPLYRAGPIRGLAELSLDAGEAELGISVDATLRRRGVGTWLVQTAGRLLAPRGIRTIRAYTTPGNASFLTLSRALGAAIETGPDEVEVLFEVASLTRGYLRRRGSQTFLPAA
jgi:GNAT superfamily N-acetyltransferase